MRRSKGFKVKTKLAKICRWVTTRPGKRRRRTRTTRRRRELVQITRNPITKVIRLARRLRKRAYGKLKPLINGDPRYVQLGARESRDPTEVTAMIPKGHLAVYVGKSEQESQRYLVPVMYFNHPLFGELLKEAERVFGFDQPGRITIPCGPTEFEKVQMRIASADQVKAEQRRRLIHAHYWL